MSNIPVTLGVAATSSYGFQCVLPKQDFTLAVTQVTEALKAYGGAGHRFAAALQRGRS